MARALVACVVLAFAHDTLAQRNPIKEALLLHNDNFTNATFEDCVWRREREPCPDPDLKLHLYTEGDLVKKVVDLNSEDWLRQSGWEPSHETILLIHGYAGGDDTLPITVLRDAYIRRGGYNVFMLDWGALAQPPCYVAAVHNLRPIARCAAEALGSLRRAGLRPDRLTCVGHSLGAHMCGVIANYLTFRLNRIIGLDPARPLIRSAPALRLDPGDARAVHVLHTNAGRYGEAARLGHADFCLNGGRSQPYCEDTPNEALCSHIWSICYQAESLFRARAAAPCGRRCSVRVPPARASALPVPLGQSAPMTASGAYCVEDFSTPFCPSASQPVGDARCCLDAQYAAAATTEPPRHRPRPLVRLRARRVKPAHVPDHEDETGVWDHN
ncbi:pancreatic lipase-related protein 2-like [Pectinophora gossypiella]|uniref:pancreatic lipase-related protein 2-like n=1 Tax=Pectinophora gossypiella TaxID=13191 RepID=UPI00214F1681|nr:pancreatic lipase-related protein 2-like [Pectinophora gossypiella]